MKRVNLLAIGLLAFAQAFPAAAAPVTLAGERVDFTFDDGLLGQFGIPSVAGNVFYFTPVGFDAQSAGGANSGFDLVNQTFNLRVRVRDGYRFDSLRLTERGDYVLLGNGASAEVGGQLRVFDAALPGNERSVSFLPDAPLTQTGFPTRNWSVDTTIAVADLNAATLNVTLQNILVASSVAGSLGFVEKKFAGLDFAVTPVPEAETWAMMLAGLGLVGFMAARRRGV